jgi:hypothetical protein
MVQQLPQVIRGSAEITFPSFAVTVSVPFGCVELVDHPLAH